MFDIVIEKGLLADGTGAKGVRGDIGIMGDRIAAIGDLSHASAGERINACGCCVAPGFVDVHTHTDITILQDPRAESQIRQGVTTEVVGNCGYGFAPFTDEARKRFLRSRSIKGVDMVWSTFAEYLTVLEGVVPGTNIAALVGHGNIRDFAMGLRRSDIATPEDLCLMAKILETCLREGAYGLSTGLEYYPGKAALPTELEKLCEVLAANGALHAAHVRNRDTYALCGFLEVLEIARNTGAKIQIAHINPKYGRPDSTMEIILSVIAKMREEGSTITIDVMPTNWNHTGGKNLLPLWAHNLGLEELVGMLKDPAGRLKLRDNPTPMWQLAVQDRWERIHHFNGRETMRHTGKSMAAVAEEYGCSGWDALCALLAEEGAEMGSLRLTSNAFATEDILAAFADPLASACSDGQAAAVDGPFAAYRISPNAYNWCESYLREFVRERGALSLEDAVRRITGLPASQIGLTERGLLREGYFADITVFNLEKLGDTVTLAECNVYPKGIETVIVNGCVAFHDGKRNLARSGRVLRA